MFVQIPRRRIDNNNGVLWHRSRRRRRRSSWRYVSDGNLFTALWGIRSSCSVFQFLISYIFLCPADEWRRRRRWKEVVSKTCFVARKRIQFVHLEETANLQCSNKWRWPSSSGGDIFARITFRQATCIIPRGIWESPGHSPRMTMRFVGTGKLLGCEGGFSRNSRIVSRLTIICSLFWPFKDPIFRVTHNDAD